MNAMTIGEQAHRYLQRRNWSVIPLIPGDKRPLIEIKRFQSARATGRQIEAWARTWPDMNLGVVAGETSNLLVLDVDVKRADRRGDRTLARLIAENGKLPATLTQRTWSGGIQVFFQHVPGVKNSANHLGPGLDIRSEGGRIGVRLPSFARPSK